MISDGVRREDCWTTTSRHYPCKACSVYRTPRRLACKLVIGHIPRELASKDLKLRKRLCLVAEDLTLRCCWFALVPSRLGYDPTFDNAADALGHAHGVFRNTTHAAARHAALISYGHALELIKSELTDDNRCRSDWTIVAIAMLGHYEILMWNDLKANRLHWSGVTTLLLSGPYN